jgi:lipopolysaccharide biosynthesis glycosyltransferase
VALASLLRSNPGVPVVAHCLHDGASPDDWEKLKQTIAGYPCELRDHRLLEQYSTSHHFKLAIPDFILEERVLYLDSDLVILGSIREIYETDLSEVYLAAVEDMTADDPSLRPYMDHDAKYFNAGVMLLNLERWREEKLAAKALAWIKSSKYPYDQEGLNAVVNGRWHPLPLRYNQQTLVFHPRFTHVPKQRDRFPASEIQEARRRPVIVHYTGMAHKPWIMGCRHPYWYLYWKYLWVTPFRFTPPEQITPGNILRSLLSDRPRAWLRKAKALLRRLFTPG